MVCSGGPGVLKDCEQLSSSVISTEENLFYCLSEIREKMVPWSCRWVLKTYSISH